MVFSMRELFSGCSSLTSIDLSNFKTDKLKYMTAMFKGCSSLTSLDLSSFNTGEVTDMKELFSGCSSLKNINLSSFNTAITSSMHGMFWNCSNLISLDLSEFDTRHVTDMANMFNGCSSITTIFCEDSWVCKKSEDMFKNCQKLVGAATYDPNKTDVTMANPNTGYFTKTKYAYVVEDGNTLTFYYDRNRASRSGNVYDIPNESNKPAWTTDEVGNRISKAIIDGSFSRFRPESTYMWFYNLKKLTEINGLENIETENLKDISYMFSNCESLTSLDLSKLKEIKKVENLSNILSGCKALTTIDFSKIDTRNVANMSNMFSNCEALTTIDMSLFNTINVYDMSNMFSGCKTLTTLDLSKFNTSNLQNTTEMFKSCSSLNTIYCNDAWTCPNSEEMFKNCTKLVGAVAYNSSQTNATMANPENGYFTNKNNAYSIIYDNTLTLYYDTYSSSREGILFYLRNSFPVYDLTNVDGEEITKVDIDSSFKYYSPKSTDKWFALLRGMTEINGIENINTENVVNMEGMFYSCVKLTSLDLSKLNVEKVTVMDGMFMDCRRLKTIYCNDTWTLGAEDNKDNNMFYGCKKLVGAVPYDNSKTGISMANPDTGYFTRNVPSGIGTATDKEISITEIYTADGRRIAEPQRGLNILRMSNGTTRKVIKK